MKEIINDRNANAHTLNGMCKALVKKYKGLLLNCIPHTNKNGKVINLSCTTKIHGEKIVYNFHLDGADILDSKENLELMCYKIQDLCEQIIEMNTTN